MKVILTRPVKLKGVWHKADSQADVTKGEYDHLSKKGACVKPLMAVEEDPSFTDPKEAVKDAIESGEVTGSGLPTVDSLKSRLGRDVSSEERDSWYLAYKG